ncbi:MAG: zinc-dependent metalloprotease [Microthrixaceae bacterium]
MSFSDPFGSDSSGEDNPFESMNFFLQDLSKMFSGSSAGSWDTALQLAGAIATEGQPEPNVDPSDRLAIEQLARVAELHVGEVTGRSVEHTVRIEALNRTQWAKRFLDEERPLLEELSGSIGAALQSQLGAIEEEGFDQVHPDQMQLPGMPPEALIKQLMAMMGPMLLGMMAGSTAGHLATRAFGHYELPLPRTAEEPLTLVLRNVDAFADDWSLPREAIRLWVCLSDVAHQHVLTIDHVHAHLDGLLGEYVSAFSQDPAEIERRMRDLGVDEDLGGSEPELEALQRLAGDPDVLLSAMQSEEQRALMPRIEAVVATVEGYVDWVLDTLGARLIPEYERVTEALRRRRVEAGPASRFVERLFGLELSQSTFDRGSAFIDGIVQRSGTEALSHLWNKETHLPTPAELDAPGLWIARVGIESHELLLDELPEFEIPDFPDLD